MGVAVIIQVCISVLMIGVLFAFAAIFHNHTDGAEIKNAFLWYASAVNGSAEAEFVGDGSPLILSPPCQGVVTVTDHTATITAEAGILQSPCDGIITHAASGAIRVRHRGGLEVILRGALVLGVARGQAVSMGDLIATAEGDINVTVMDGKTVVNADGEMLAWANCV